jgi:hypothetical protein
MDAAKRFRRHQFPTLSLEREMGPRDRRAHEQFAREYAEQIVRTRAALLERTQ